MATEMRWPISYFTWLLLWILTAVSYTIRWHFPFLRNIKLSFTLTLLGSNILILPPLPFKILTGFPIIHQIFILFYFISFYFIYFYFIFYFILLSLFLFYFISLFYYMVGLKKIPVHLDSDFNIPFGSVYSCLLPLTNASLCEFLKPPVRHQRIPPSEYWKSLNQNFFYSCIISLWVPLAWLLLPLQYLFIYTLNACITHRQKRVWCVLTNWAHPHKEHPDQEMEDYQQLRNPSMTF